MNRLPNPVQNKVRGGGVSPLWLSNFEKAGAVRRSCRQKIDSRLYLLLFDFTFAGLRSHRSRASYFGFCSGASNHSWAFAESYRWQLHESFCFSCGFQVWASLSWALQLFPDYREGDCLPLWLTCYGSLAWLLSTNGLRSQRHRRQLPIIPSQKENRTNHKTRRSKPPTRYQWKTDEQLSDHSSRNIRISTT